MALESGAFQLGGAVFPLGLATGNSLLRDADPALWYALDFFEAILNIHLGQRLAAEASIVGLSDITEAVRYKAPIDPERLLTEQHVRFPLLTLCRSSTRWTERTTTWAKGESRWAVTWVLPPLTPAQAERLYPAATAAGLILNDRITMGHDPAYLANANVWTLAGLEEISLESSSLGHWKIGDDLDFYVFEGVIRVVERQMPISGAYEDLAGIDTQIDNTDQDGTSVDNVSDFKSDGEPPGP